MGRVALAEVGRPQRRRSLKVTSRRAIRALKAELDGEIEVGRPEPGAKPDRPWPDRRISHLPPSRRARPGHALFRQTPAAAPPYGQDRIGEDVVRLTYVPA